MTWRVGEHYGIHVYNGEEPVATFHNSTDAARAVLAVNIADAEDVAAPTLAELAARIAQRLDQHWPREQAAARQVLALAEEAGEFVGAYRRWAGLARRLGSFADVRAELADVVITAYVAADALRIDLDRACQDKAKTIFTRGFRDKPERAQTEQHPTKEQGEHA